MSRSLDLPVELRSVLDAVRRVGRPRLVGGCVRDWLWGLTPKDFDVEVLGTGFETLLRTLSPFGSTDVVGRSFGVIKLRLGSGDYDFGLPRRESKTGAGHRGFHVEPDPSLSDAAAAARRDFTINAIAYDPYADAIIDPWDGQRDLAARCLRHTSDAFVEDPLRVLRAMQFAARFDLELASETTALCRTISSQFSELAVERIWGEWDKWAVQATRPSRALGVLLATDWLKHFPEIAAMHGLSQDPEWHPEGDVLIHTGHALDALVRMAEWQAAAPALRRVLSLAVLAHDFGKASTTERREKHGRIRWVSPGHDTAGVPLVETFLRRLGAPLETIPAVQRLVASHHSHHLGEGRIFSSSHVRRLAQRLAPATIDELSLVMLADCRGRPPLVAPGVEALIRSLVAKARSLAIHDSAPQPVILGRHLIALALAPGPHFKKILEACFEAQLDGVFTDEAGGLRYLRKHLREHHPDLASGLPPPP